MKEYKESHLKYESIPDCEGQEIDETADLTVKLQDTRAQDDTTPDGRPLRGVHAKSHGCLGARFVVNEDVDPQYQVGLFANPGRAHDAWVRFSNAAVLREDDLKADREGVRKNGSRGMAVKVLDVDGDMLDLDGGRQNQDFLMINTPRFAFANARDYLRLDRILALDPKGADPSAYFIPAILAQLGEPRDGEPAEVSAKRNALKDISSRIPFLKNLTREDLMGTIASAKVAKLIETQVVRNPLEVQYFGAAPFMFGADKVMKFSAKPVTPVAQPPFEDITPTNPSPDYLREALAETMQGTKEICFEFMVQTQQVPGEELKIEDATTTWDNELENYQSVARLVIAAPQTPHTAEEEAICEQLAFTPWHSLAAFRPIGGINRLRRKVYHASAEHRSALGG
ncbi:MAG: hypothetical protein ABJM29_01485 [Rhizobiaceae bacterium]